jgi:CRP-like cAMP-binding protein
MMSSLTEELMILSQVRALEGVSETGLRQILGIARERKFSPGEVIIHEGEVGNSIFIIKQGEVEISMAITLPLSEREREKVLVRLGKGSLFGEVAFVFGEEQRTATVVSRTEVSLLEVSSSDFEKIISENMRDGLVIFKNIARIMAERLRKANQDIAKLTTVLSVVLSKVERRR